MHILLCGHTKETWRKSETPAHRQRLVAGALCVRGWDPPDLYQRSGARCAQSHHCRGRTASCLSGRQGKRASGLILPLDVMSAVEMQTCSSFIYRSATKRRDLMAKDDRFVGESRQAAFEREKTVSGHSFARSNDGFTSMSKPV